MSGERIYQLFCVFIGTVIGAVLGWVIGPFWGFVLLGALLGLVFSSAEGAWFEF